LYRHAVTFKIIQSRRYFTVLWPPATKISQLHCAKKSRPRAKRQNRAQTWPQKPGISTAIGATAQQLAQDWRRIFSPAIARYNYHCDAANIALPYGPAL
jgi:hypothetical protein